MGSRGASSWPRKRIWRFTSRECFPSWSTWVHRELWSGATPPQDPSFSRLSGESPSILLQRSTTGTRSLTQGGPTRLTGAPEMASRGHKTQDTRHKTQDTRHKTQDTGHKTQLHATSCSLHGIRLTHYVLRVTFYVSRFTSFDRLGGV